MIAKYPVFKDAFWLASIWFFVWTSPAQAYFDLNMCSYMLQLTFGIGAAFWFSFKSSLLNAFFKKKSTETQEKIVSDDAANSIESQEKSENN